jgi:hypothetical protein
MAKKVTTLVELIDDLDGGKAERSIAFGWDGNTYEIDLSKKNATALEKLLRPYVEAARKVRRPVARSARASTPAGRRPDLGQIREWARANGLEVSDRGRIAASVQEAYDAAHKS